MVFVEGDEAPKGAPASETDQARSEETHMTGVPGLGAGGLCDMCSFMGFMSG